MLGCSHDDHLLAFVPAPAPNLPSKRLYQGMGCRPCPASTPVRQRRPV